MRLQRNRVKLFDDNKHWVGIHIALKSMRLHEEAWVRIQPQYQRLIINESDLAPFTSDNRELLFKFILHEIKRPVKQATGKDSKITFSDTKNQLMQNDTTAKTWFKKSEFKNAAKYFEKSKIFFWLLGRIVFFLLVNIYNKYKLVPNILSTLTKKITDTMSPE